MRNSETDFQWFVRNQLDTVATIEARLISAVRSGRKEDITFVMNDLGVVFADCHEASSNCNEADGYNLGRVMHAATSVLQFGKGALFALDAPFVRDDFMHDNGCINGKRS